MTGEAPPLNEDVSPLKEEEQAETLMPKNDEEMMERIKEKIDEMQKQIEIAETNEMKYGSNY